jgi:flavin reductase (DIM6/NTAB) family NADH-FMN oxidoreductase RutF
MSTKDGFVEIAPEQLSENAWKLVGSDWMLITAGTPDSFNTMTASWGGLGVIWGKSIAICVIRPQRHTYGFVEKSDHFTLSFFSEDHRDALKYCGSVSGRDEDKIEKTGLTPVTAESGSVYFKEARIVLECRKIYYQDIDPDHFLLPEIDDNYPAKDYHRMYFGEILRCLSRDV